MSSFVEGQTTLKRKIKSLFETRNYYTTLLLNDLASTVDSRKIISLLRKDGLKIESKWHHDPLTGKNYKIYHLN